MATSELAVQAGTRTLSEIMFWGLILDVSLGRYWSPGYDHMPLKRAETQRFVEVRCLLHVGLTAGREYTWADTSGLT